jgi:hypothetical protein
MVPQIARFTSVPLREDWLAPPVSLTHGVDNSSVIKALAVRGVALSSAAWTVLGDDSVASSASIDDLERAVSRGD